MVKNGGGPKKQKIVLFYGGHMSQWHECNFVIDGMTFNCAEQWMMWSKAICFGDFRIANAIMSEDDPKVQKSMGRSVSHFDHVAWDKVSDEVVFQGNLAKYSQNEDLKKALLRTGGAILAEASPTDAVWGICLREDDPRALDMTRWRGENRLGKAIMKVRNHLRY